MHPTSAGRPSLAFVGAGRAGSALATALTTAGYRIAAVHSRSSERAASLAVACGSRVAASAAAAAASAEITFLTVPDAEVAPLAASIGAAGVPLGGRSLVHCSASAGPSLMATLRRHDVALGALHPLQALAGASSASLLRGSTFALEAPAPLRATLRRLVTELGGHVLELPEGMRHLYHAAAVLVGNAPLALLARASTLLEEAGLDAAVAHRALASLLEGAAHNAAAGGPAAALTGPVERGDAATVASHLDVLAADPSTRELYRRLAIEMLALAGLQGREGVAEVLAVAGVPSGRVVAHPRVA